MASPTAPSRRLRAVRAAAGSSSASYADGAWWGAPPDVTGPLPYARFEALRSALGVPQRTLAEAVGASERSVLRYKASGEVPADVAARLARLEWLFGLAMRALGGQDGARAWFTGYVPLLGAVPLTIARTDRGARGIEQVLGGIEFGFVA